MISYHRQKLAPTGAMKKATPFTPVTHITDITDVLTTGGLHLFYELLVVLVSIEISWTVAQATVVITDVNVGTSARRQKVGGCFRRHPS